MDKVGILYHPLKAESLSLCAEVESWLTKRGISVVSGGGFDDHGRQNQVLQEIESLSLLIVLGGDGATLRAAQHTAPYGVPIFGINLGRVGFLSEAEPDNWPERLEPVMVGDWWPEERLMLRVALVRDGKQVVEMRALNDVVIGRSGQARVIRLRLYVDEDYVTTYTADGLVVATPTGSTAYAMAAGGPLLWPRLPNFLVIPVAPHLSLDRALVLHQTAIVSIGLEPELEATLTVDGRGGYPVQFGDRVIVRQNENSCTFARVGQPSYFYHRLMARFGYWHPLKEA